MSFTILTATTDSEGIFESVGWAYSTASGMITGDHSLQMPRGEVSLETVDVTMLTSWIADQMDTTHFDSLCASRGFFEKGEDVSYVVDVDGQTLIIPSEEPVGVGSTS